MPSSSPFPSSIHLSESSITNSSASPQVTNHNFSTPTLVEGSGALSRSESRLSGSTTRGEDRSDVDSIWNADLDHWERRRRLDDAIMQEIRDLAPTGIAVGFAVTPGNSRAMSRRPSKTPGGRSALNSGFNSVAPSSSELGRAEANVSLPQQSSWSFWHWLSQNRRMLRKLMRMKKFHLVMIGLVGFDLIVVMVELILALLTASCPTEQLYNWLLEAINATSDHHLGLHPSAFACTLAPSPARSGIEIAIFSTNVGLLSIFTIEVFVAIYAFGPKTYGSSWVSVLDGFVVVATLCLDIYFHLSTSPAAKSPVALVILRLWKIFRAVHAIAHALEMHYQEVVETSLQGREKLEWERISESIRLQYCRRALIKASGEDVDPVLVEEEVKREVAIIERKRAVEVEERDNESQAAPACVSSWKQWLALRKSRK